MSLDVISCLQLDKDLPCRLIVVKEVNGGDSSFIDSCVLNHCIKTKSHVVLISTHNSLNHYQNVGLKMNYNLQKHISESGLIKYHNLAEESVDNLLTDTDISIQDLLQKTSEKVSSWQSDAEVNIILDGVSHLFDLQCSLKEVNEFIIQLFEVIKHNKNSFFLCHCNDAAEDDVTHIMANMLVHKAHTVLEIESLPSGWSADVSGHMTVKHPGEKFDKRNMFLMDMKPMKYLYKLFDRGVKLLAPGTV